ncbi:MAG: hypothetical protein HY834_08105 [Devosia nanyangense]|uniref:DUF1127 domain-containing protein n=1 Tax=Devosia nanyangense TaxID=1228055 RepID=A0A933NYG6_9HYPH|nr:hypothetical protein [Devosia nanyangense]
MSRRNSLLRRAADFVSILGAAAHAANAGSESWAPKDRDLRTLGIDPARFRAIGR